MTKTIFEGLKEVMSANRSTYSKDEEEFQKNNALWREVARDLADAGFDPNELTPTECFDKWCDYEGLIGYGPKLRRIVFMLDQLGPGLNK